MKKAGKHIRDWLKAFLWALGIAWTIRTFFIQGAFIPSQSMEQSLLSGDFVFISKLSYGPRLPITPVAMPFMHQHLPLSETPSYFSWPQLPYLRLPGLSEVQRFDVVVFNYPMDTEMPVDRRTLYVKRCVGLPGDSLEIKAKRVYINGKKLYDSPNLQFNRHVKASGLLRQSLLDSLSIVDGGLVSNIFDYEFPLTDSVAAQLARQSAVSKVSIRMDAQGDYQAHIFPHSRNFPFNNDFWGPLVVPKKGLTVALNDTNVVLYERIIRNFENKNLEIKDGRVFIDGNMVDKYTFEMDYFFMMGDNRDNSADSRSWGFVPEDHIVGKAWVIFFSYNPQPKNGGIRWNRIFQRII